MKLRKWVKVVLTILVILGSIKIYTEIGQIQMKDISSIKYQLPVILGWIWLIIGQIMVYTAIWEKK